MKKSLNMLKGIHSYHKSEMECYVYHIRIWNMKKQMFEYA